MSPRRQLKNYEAQKKQNEITDWASVLLRDLGLDYQALMNVAGDNVNVLEIWNEMQRLAAERTKETTNEVVKQVEAVKRLNIDMPDFDLFGSMMSGFKDPLQNFNPDEITSMTSAMESLKNKNDEVTASIQRQGEAMVNHAMAMGEMAETIGFTLAQAATGQLTLSQAVARSLQVPPVQGKTLLSLLPSLVPDLVRSKHCLIKLDRIKEESAGAAMGSPSESRRTSNMGERIELVLAGDAGKIFKAKMIEQDRRDSRTRS